MGQIMDDLLMKAQRDKSKLVQVQRSVSRGGKTFMQNFWVNPNQVKSTDKVVGGQQNLLPQPGSVPKPAAGVLDKAYFDSIKSDRAKALNYLKSCGVKWTEHSHTGINWMRANQAFTAALNGQNGQKIAPQGKSQSTPKNHTSAQNSASGGIILTSAQQAEVDSGKNGKEKVVILKKLLGKDECIQYAKQMGVTWDEHSFDAINNMRMSVALTKYFDVTDGTVSPTGGKSNKVNGTSKKDDLQVQQSTPPDDDKVEIPVDAKEREKNIINIINSITDEKTLDLIIKSGFVPEDDNAREFIEKSLYAEYNKILKNQTGSPRYNYYVNQSALFASDVSDITTKMFKGLPKKLIRQAVNDSRFVLDTSMLQMVSPRETFTILNGVRHNSDSPDYGNKTSDIPELFKLCSMFSTYEDIQHDTRGYIGDDLSVSESQYSLEKDGFARILDHIGSTQSELKVEVESMKKDYDELMRMCNGNHKKLSAVLTTKYEDFKIKHENQIVETEAIEILKNLLQTSGFSQSEIDATLSAKSFEGKFFDYIRFGKLAIKSSKSYGDYKKDSNGIDVSIDISNLRTSNGTQIMDILRPDSSNFLGYRGMSKAYEGYRNIYSDELSESDYNKIIDLTFKLFGTKVVDETTKLPPDTPHSQRSRCDNSNLVYVPDGDNPEKDAVLMNLITIGKGINFKQLINDGITMCPPSAANQNGLDYTGNFNYYSPSNSIGLGDSPDNKDEIDRLNNQLSQTKTYSLDYCNNLKKYVDEHGDSSYRPDSWGSYKTPEVAKAASVCIAASKLTPESFGKNSTPATDLFLDMLVDAAQYCPQNFGTRTPDAEKVKMSVRKKMGHEPYKFVNSTQPALVTPLKQLRENAFKKANCSLVSVDAQKRQDIEHEVKINFDKVDANGKRVPKPDRSYDNRTLVFHSGVYEIKNSEMIEDFEKESQRIGETPKHMYHGTSYSAACGINGVDGRFRYKDSDRTSGQKRSGSMLGEGIYVAKLIGKCCPYIGSDPYSYTSYTANDVNTSNNASDGCLIILDTVLGKHGEFNDSSEARRNNKNNGGTYDSVAVGAGALMPGGTRLKEYECIVTRQNMVAPRYLVDVGARRR